MVKMINAVTGTDMWVMEDRVVEYRSLGHKIAKESIVSVMTGEPKAEPPIEKTNKTLKKAIEKTKATRKKA